MKTRLAAAALLLMTVPAVRADMEPAGPEFQVNTFTPYEQRDPAIAGDASGRFVVTWESGSYYGGGGDGSREGIFGQRFDATAAPVGPEFQVNTYTTAPQIDPAVAMDAAGRFTISWSSGYFSSYYPSQDGSAFGAFVQRFDAAGTPLGSEFRANTFTPGPQRQSAVAAEGSGNFVVVWTSGSYYFGSQQDGSDAGVFAQRYDASGTPVGPEFQVNTYTTDYQGAPVVTVESGGGFVVAWTSGYYASGPDGAGRGIFARRFSSTGTPLGPEFQVNTYTTAQQTYPAIAAGPGGGFVVTWMSNAYNFLQTGQDGSRGGIFGQRYDATGTPAGPEFQVNTYTTGTQTEPAVAVDPSGAFVVVWTSSYTDQDGSESGVFGQHFTSAGVPAGPEFQVNTYTPGYQDGPAITAGPEGTFTVAWQGTYGQDGSGRGVFARRFRAAGPLRALPGSMLRLRDNPISASARRLLVRSVDAAITLGGGNGSADDPTLTGGRLRVKSAFFDDLYELPAANWRTIGSAGTNQGYLYRDRLLTAGPVSSVKVRASGLVRITAKGAQLGHSLGGNPDPVTVTLQTGNLGHRYCMTFGGATRFAPGTLFRAAGAPAVCAP